MAIPLLAVFPLILSEEDSTADDELDCEDESRGVAWIRIAVNAILVINEFSADYNFFITIFVSSYLVRELLIGLFFI